MSSAKRAGGTVASEVRIGISADRSDRVTLSANQTVERTKVIYRMSDLKKKADETMRTLLSQSSNTEQIESISGGFGDLDRQERIEIAKLRVNSGFYDREDVIEEIARKISDKV
ncbi:hypothetical protein JYU03_00500 [bacterium AH-315-F03]|nr:hypothetical protein [bacterium AH-315-F03]